MATAAENAPVSPPDAPTLDIARVEALAGMYRLALPERQRTFLSGDLSGRRTGNSIEYQDRKDYVPGDDVRHIDWRAYARNDRLTVKLYREEITPRVDILVDASDSMWTTPGKATRLMETALLMARLSERLHARVRLETFSDRLRRLGDPLALSSLEGRPADDLMPLLHASAASRTGGIKILISDFLFPFSPEELIGLYRRADRVLCIQVLAAFEAAPPRGGEVRLEDAETGERLDVALSRDTVEGYVRRLEHLREEMTRRLRVQGGALARLRDDDDLDGAARKLLLAGAIEA